jgi:hypothetical protein
LNVFEFENDAHSKENIPIQTVFDSNPLQNPPSLCHTSNTALGIASMLLTSLLFMMAVATSSSFDIPHA